MPARSDLAIAGRLMPLTIAWRTFLSDSIVDLVLKVKWRHCTEPA